MKVIDWDTLVYHTVKEILVFSFLGGDVRNKERGSYHCREGSRWRVARVESWELRVESWELRVESWELRIENWELRVEIREWERDLGIWGEGSTTRTQQLQRLRKVICAYCCTLLLRWYVHAKQNVILFAYSREQFLFCTILLDLRWIVAQATSLTNIYAFVVLKAPMLAVQNI